MKSSGEVGEVVSMGVEVIRGSGYERILYWDVLLRRSGSILSADDISFLLRLGQ